jgi:tRNA 2-thiouridine synthesizing protein A
VLAAKMKAGEVLEVVADCPTFEKDMREWVTRSKKVLLFMKDEPGGGKRCQIRI